MGISEMDVLASFTDHMGTKLGAVEVSPEILAYVMISGQFHVKVKSDLPKDSELVALVWDRQELSPRFLFIFQSAEFAELEEQQSIPILAKPRLTSMDCPLLEKDKNDGRDNKEENQETSGN